MLVYNLYTDHTAEKAGGLFSAAAAAVIEKAK